MEYRSLQLKHREFSEIREYYDSQILSEKYEGIYTCAVKISEQIRFADYSYFAPDFDLNGKKIRYVKKWYCT